MNRNYQLLWSSISILVGVVIGILAFTRGTLELVLLIAAFTVWGAWLILKFLMPSWRRSRAERETEQRAQQMNGAAEGSNLDAATGQFLLHHVNYRISEYLAQAYPNIRWEWMLDDPVPFVLNGGTARIRVFCVPDYEFADVTLDRQGQLSCSFVKVVPVNAEQKGEQSEINPQVWYETQGRGVLQGLITDLNSRGHKKLFIDENGDITIQPGDDGKEVAQGVLRAFPAKVYWEKLVEVMHQAGLSAAILDNYVTVSW